MDKGKLLFGVSSAVLMGLATQAAHAGGFVLVQPPPAPVVQAVIPSPAPLAAADRLLTARDWGASVPLQIAARSILPDGFILHQDATVPNDVSLGWAGPGRWQDVFKASLAKQGLSFKQEGQLIIVYKGHISSALKADIAPPALPGSITLSQALPPQPATTPASASTPTPTKAPAVAVAATTGGPGSAEAEIAPSIALDPLAARRKRSPNEIYGPADGGYGMWYAPKGQTLSAIVGAWSAQSGWTFKYDAQNITYKMEAALALKGTFTDAVASLIYSIRSDPRPTVEFHLKNKMVIVKSDD